MACSRGCCETQQEHYRSISFGTAESVRVTAATERRWAKDHAAYRRLRAEGLQPHDLDGAAELEAKAKLPIEIEMGRVARDEKERAGLAAGVRLSEDLGLTG